MGLCREYLHNLNSSHRFGWSSLALRMKIEQFEDYIAVSQTAYLNKILHRFGLPTQFGLSQMQSIPSPSACKPCSMSWIWRDHSFRHGTISMTIEYMHSLECDLIWPLLSTSISVRNSSALINCASRLLICSIYLRTCTIHELVQNRTNTILHI